MPLQKFSNELSCAEEISLGFLRGREGTVFLKNVQQRHALDYADAWGFFDTSGLCLRVSLLSEAPEALFLQYFQGHSLRSLLSSEGEANMLFYLRYATQREDPLFRIFEYRKSRKPHTFVIIFVRTPFVVAGKQVVAFFIQEIRSSEGILSLEEEHEAFRRNEVIRDMERHRKLTPWAEKELLFLGLSPETLHVTCLVERGKNPSDTPEQNPLWPQKLSRCLLREQRYFCWNGSGRMGVLLPQRKDFPPCKKTERDQGFLLLKLCEELFPGEDFIIGLAGKPRPLKHFCTSLEEAVRACQGYLFGRKERVIHFNDIGYGKLLDPHTPVWEAFLHETLEPLLPENEKNTMLLNSLEALLEYATIPEAAEALHVHPNTLSYRKRQIETLLKVELQNLHTKTNLLLAIKALRLRSMGEEDSAAERSPSNVRLPNRVDRVE